MYTFFEGFVTYGLDGNYHDEYTPVANVEDWARSGDGDIEFLPDSDEGAG
jgi:hypothetical protein